MRGFVVGLVVLHHAVLAYCTFGHVNRPNFALSTAPIVDPHRWVGFDLVVELNDGFFMPLLFLLSGLFVWDGLSRKGARAFLWARVLRLGVSFLIAELTVVPLAYYPSFLQAGGTPGFARFWIGTVTAGPWPSGPPWFIGILLLFDAAAALAFVLASRRGAATSASPPARRPGRAFALLFAGSCLLYLPFLLTVGPTRWFGIGPLAIQGSRVGLYATYFAAGVAMGRSGRRDLARFGQAIAGQWAPWVLVAALMGAMLIGVAAMSARGGLDLPPWSASALLGTARAAFCATASFAVPALFLRFGEGRSPPWDSLAANSFAIYLLHYPFVTWTQSGLLAVPINAPAKGAITFAVAFVASWAAARLLRHLPLVERVL